MARTQHTKKPSACADESESELRIVQRRPRPGDSHAAPATVIRGALRKVPPEYLVGLRRIELLPRQGGVGEPFALYRQAEKTIKLYSLPMEWEWPNAPQPILRSMRRFLAEIVPTSSGGVVVRWNDPIIRTVWFVMQVLAHELGHHYNHQYRRRRKPSMKLWREELRAQLHAARMENGFRPKRKQVQNGGLTTG